MLASFPQDCPYLIESEHLYVFHSWIDDGKTKQSPQLMNKKARRDEMHQTV
jgi:hypothetical protein